MHLTATCCLLTASHCSLLTARCLSLTAHCSSILTTHYSLLTTHYSPWNSAWNLLRIARRSITPMVYPLLYVLSPQVIVKVHHAAALDMVPLKFSDAEDELPFDVESPTH